MAIANVTLNNTVDEWRTLTNQVINFVNEVDGQQLFNVASNTAQLTVRPKVSRNETLFISLNVSSDVLDTSTLNVATANAVNVVYFALANTDANLALVKTTAETANDLAHILAGDSLITIASNKAAYDHANLAFGQANTGRTHANSGFAVANAGLIQANTARDHANASFAVANGGIIQANTARDHANASFAVANGGILQANTARDHANAAHLSANAGLVQANTARTHANAAFGVANAAFSNTSGSSFVGNMQIPSGNVAIGDVTAAGTRLVVNHNRSVANVFPQIKILNGSAFVNFNANTSVGAFNDLMLDRDASIIFSNGGIDDGANIVLGPWTNSGYGYKQDSVGRHGFNTLNPRYTVDVNGTANISSYLLVGAMNVVPTVTAAFAKANTIGTLGTQSSSAVTITGGSISGITDLALADGGTNASLTASHGAIAYSNASAIVLSSVGSSGQVLTSTGAGAPTWTSQSAMTVGTATNWGAYGAVPAAGTSFGNPSTIGRSDASGYTYFNYINSNTTNSENPGISQFIVTNGTDNFYRKASLGYVATNIRSAASGTWGIDISGTAAVATSAPSYLPLAGGTMSGGLINTSSLTTYYGAGAAGIIYLNSAQNRYLHYDGSSYVLGNAPLYVSGTISTAGSLSVQGTISSVGAISSQGNITAYSTSDRTLKENIKRILNPVEKLKKINGVTFDWTQKNIDERGGEDGYFVRKHDVGVIAQEIEEVLPEIVARKKDGTLGVKYELITPLLIEAVKELADKVELLQTQIEELKK